MSSHVIQLSNLWRCIIDLDSGSPSDILVEAPTKEDALYIAFTSVLSEEGMRLWLWKECIFNSEFCLKYEQLLHPNEEMDEWYIVSLIKDLNTLDEIFIDAKQPALEDYWEFLGKF